MRNLLHDIRFGLRVLSGSPGFSAVAAMTLGLGIACTTTVFSWVDSVLLHPYPATTRPDELVSLDMVTTVAPTGGNSISWPDYRDYRDRMKTFAGLTVHRQCAFTLGDDQPARLAWGELVAGNYFDVMGVKAVAGRTFTAQEAADTLGASRVTVISARLWRSYFHSDPGIVGRTVRVNRQTLTIVGVVPAGFRGSSPVMQFDLWIPMTMAVELGSLRASTFTDRGDRGMLTPIARLAPGVSLQQARAEAAALAGSLAIAVSDDQPADARHSGSRLGRTQRSERLPARSADDFARRLVRGAVDRLRECGESSSGAERGEAARVRHPFRAGRGAGAGSAADAHRDAGARRGWVREWDC